MSPAGRPVFAGGQAGRPFDQGTAIGRAAPDSAPSAPLRFGGMGVSDRIIVMRAGSADQPRDAESFNRAGLLEAITRQVHEVAV